ncbi:MAG TPA: 3D domain-containing protein [Clostridium sp.]
MFKLKRHMIRVYMLLEICLIGIGANYLSSGSENIQINKFVAGKYEGSSKIGTADIKVNRNPVGTPIKAELTAYCNDPRCSDQWGSQTAMQTETRLGVIAAPSNIPLGSKMYIPELENYKADGMFDVEDRGGAIKVKEDGTYVIDVWVPTYEEAVKFGRKNTTIYLVE